jgi:maltooligosyltrehalose trehalohydrolase
MLFQGEEWAASTPFAFFTSHPEEDLGRATAEGRLAEFEKMGWDPAVVPDPQDPQTFLSSKLDWSEPETGRHARVLAFYRALGALRRQRPELTDPSFAATRCEVDEAGRLVRLWRRDTLVALNLGDSPAIVPVEGELLLGTTAGPAVEDGVLTLPPHAGAVVGEA